MASDPPPELPKILVAVQDAAVRERLRGLLDASALELEWVDSKSDPLQVKSHTSADLILIRRSDVKQADLRQVDTYTNEHSTPGLIVLTENGDSADRARLLAAGASSVLEITDTDRELRENIEAIAGAEHQGAITGPVSIGEEPRPRLADFLSRSARMKRFVDLVRRVVDTDTSLLITGETGVGKERLAQAIHNEGARCNHPFVSVNCGALPEALLESELFGHEAGAFTGASKRKRGRFEQANGGTIFLDEVGEMPTHLQVNLLSVLQRRRVQRVGSEKTVAVDVRVVAATNRHVEQDVKKGRFREDLYYRLNVVPLDVPALRERPEDIPNLAGRFIHHFRDALARPKVETISDEALAAMMDYDWPGNIRELINAMEHAVVLCRTSQISISDLPDRLVGRRRGHSESRESPVRAGRVAFQDEWLALSLREARDRIGLDFEREYLAAQLTRTEGKVGETAKSAGISPRSLYDKMKRHGLRKEDYR